MAIKKTSVMRVDPRFKDLFIERSEKSGLSIVDLTRLAAVNGEGGVMKIVVKERKKKRGRSLFEMDMDDIIMGGFR